MNNDAATSTDPRRRSGPVPQYPIESVDRALQLIEMLGRCPEVKLSEVRDSLGIGQSTAHRLMAMLVYRGFAVQSRQTRVYGAGPTLFSLGRSGSREHHLVAAGRPALEWLAERSGETVHLGVLAGSEIRYLDAVESSATLRVTARAGQFGYAHTTSLGKAMLATFDDDHLRRRYANLSLVTVTARSIADLPALLAEIRRTRTRGWSRNREEMESGVCSVGMALMHPGYGLLGALSVATPKARSSAGVEIEHAELLRQAAQRFLSDVGTLVDDSF